MAFMTANTSTHTAQALASHRWAELNTRDFAALDPARTVAVLPLGATEQHGPHLPLSVDTVLVDGVVNAALGHLAATDPVLVLPTQALGLSTEHTAFAGTLHLSPQTLIQLWCDIGASVARAGVKKLLMFNAHGGNVGLMDVVARAECQMELYGSYVMAWNWKMGGLRLHKWGSQSPASCASLFMKVVIVRFAACVKQWAIPSFV